MDKAKAAALPPFEPQIGKPVLYKGKVALITAVLAPSIINLVFVEPVAAGASLEQVNHVALPDWTPAKVEPLPG